MEGVKSNKSLSEIYAEQVKVGERTLKQVKEENRADEDIIKIYEGRLTLLRYLRDRRRDSSDKGEA